MASPVGAGAPEHESSSGNGQFCKVTLLKGWGIKLIERQSEARCWGTFDIATFRGRNVFSQFLTSRPRWFSVCSLDANITRVHQISSVLHAIRAGQVFARHASNTYFPTHSILPLLDGTIIQLEDSASTPMESKEATVRVSFLLVHYVDDDPDSIVPYSLYDSASSTPTDTNGDLWTKAREVLQNQLQSFLNSPPAVIRSRCTSFWVLAELISPSSTFSSTPAPSAVQHTPPKDLRSYTYTPTMYPLPWETGVVPLHPRFSPAEFVVHPLLVLENVLQSSTLVTSSPPQSGTTTTKPATITTTSGTNVPLPPMSTGSDASLFQKCLPGILLHLQQQGQVGSVVLDWGGGNQPVPGKRGALPNVLFPHGVPTPRTDTSPANTHPYTDNGVIPSSPPNSALSSPPYVLQFGPLAYEHTYDLSSITTTLDRTPSPTTSNTVSNEIPYESLFPPEHRGPHESGASPLSGLFRPFPQAMPYDTDARNSAPSAGSPNIINVAPDTAPDTTRGTLPSRPPLTLGRYLEHRALYTSSQFTSTSETNCTTEPRTVHLGIDIGVEIPTHIRNPVPTPLCNDVRNVAPTHSNLVDTAVHGSSNGASPHNNNTVNDSRALRTNETSTDTITKGTSVFTPGTIDVYSPLPGTVHSWSFTPEEQDYGVCVLLEHRLEARVIKESDRMHRRNSREAPLGGVAPPEDTSRSPTITGSLYTLYGHLSLTTLYEEASPDGCAPPRLHARGPVLPVTRGGVPIGWFGDASENGGWPPHLHFQLITERLYGHSGTFPGVGERSRVAEYIYSCPDPNLLLGCPYLPLFLPRHCLFPQFSCVQVL